MCDTGLILGDVFSKVNLPFPETRASVGGFLENNAPYIKMGSDILATRSEASGLAKQRGVRMAQINAASDIAQKQTEQVQERRLGANRAAFAQSGVKMTGTAKRLLEEQVKQDEIELLKIRHERNVRLGEERNALKQIKFGAKQGVMDALNPKKGLSKELLAALGGGKSIFS